MQLAKNTKLFILNISVGNFKAACIFKLKNLSKMANFRWQAYEQKS